jgi:DNA mismatch repair protein MutL
MGKINVLDFSVANLIAAGEVVDRPASVIKELMENAIDAKARQITVEIQNGGVTFMRVSDDGCGMEPDDLPVAIRRHATSKIKDASDLEAILTLGFRGEALAAIASVSNIRILSKQHDAQLGAMLEARGGNIIGLTETGCPNGTTVIVEALFANVPARRKFLKRDVTEAQAVTQAVERVALSHPEISFKLIVDGDIKLNTAGDGRLQSATHAVFGRDFSNRMIPISGEYEGIGISGFIGRPDNVKGNRNYQNFFINGRWIKSKTAMAALEQAFCSYLSPEKYPTCVMNLTLNPARVDVNVHPAKLEVKFSNEKMIFEAIYYTVRHALEQNDVRPELKIAEPKKEAPLVSAPRRVSDAFAPVQDRREESVARRQIGITVPTPTKQPAEQPPKKDAFVRLTAEEYVREYLKENKSHSSPISPTLTSKPAPQTVAPQAASAVVETAPARVEMTPTVVETAPMVPQMPDMPPDIPMPNDADAPPVKEEYVPTPHIPAEECCTAPAADTPDQACEPAVIVPDYRIVGEVFHSYVLVEVGDKMLVIDKHAAHERILFEQLKKKLHSTQSASQLLMLPLEVMMMSDEVDLIGEYRPELEAIGFEFTTARNTVSILALPIGIDAGAAGDMLCAIADRIKNNTGSATLTRDILFEKALYQGACKAAIKAGRIYPEGHVKWLVEEMMKLPDITYCPHGRPVAMEMTKQNLDHQFERS